ncbi:hypothetical protein J6590_102461 [Homalodisca vitripennis]|nr:hypothetical protein J6590_102461 [Homalodisca vitripennis]
MLQRCSWKADYPINGASERDYKFPSRSLGRATVPPLTPQKCPSVQLFCASSLERWMIYLFSITVCTKGYEP